MADDLTNQFNTSLSPQEESAYQAWATKNNRQNDTYDYDMRGAFKSGVTQSESGHFPDTYKKPNHPTFSNESIYHGGDYQGGIWSKNNDIDVFKPGATNLQQHGIEGLQEYIKRSDPSVMLDRSSNMPLDAATIKAVLDKQGMPNTTENLNRIAQFDAVAPDMLKQYLGQGTDAARTGGGTDAAIDRSIASTADPRLAALAGPNPYTATLDPNTGLTNIGPGLVKGQAEPRGGGGGGGPAKPPGIPGDLNAPVGAPPFPKQGAPQGGVTSESEMNNPRINPAGVPTHAGDTSPGSGGSWTNYIVPSIMALFGAQMARRGLGRDIPRPGAVTPPISQAIPNAPAVTPNVAAPVVAPNAPHMPQPAPSGPATQPGGVPQRGPVPTAPMPYENTPVGPHMPQPSDPNRPAYMPPLNRAGQSPEAIARMAAETEAENARNAALLQQSIKGQIRQGQTPAQQTVGAAKSATGRQP